MYIYIYTWWIYNHIIYIYIYMALWHGEGLAVFGWIWWCKRLYTWTDRPYFCQAHVVNSISQRNKTVIGLPWENFCASVLWWIFAHVPHRRGARPLAPSVHLYKWVHAPLPLWMHPTAGAPPPAQPASFLQLGVQGHWNEVHAWRTCWPKPWNDLGDSSECLRTVADFCSHYGLQTFDIHRASQEYELPLQRVWNLIVLVKHVADIPCSQNIQRRNFQRIRSPSEAVILTTVCMCP